MVVTQLQDAVPMTLGQEFRAFQHPAERSEKHQRTAELLLEVNLGATAIGTESEHAEKVLSAGE